MADPSFGRSDKRRYPRIVPRRTRAGPTLAGPTLAGPILAGRAPALPARRRRVVGVAGIDPAFAGRRLFQLPERRLGLQPVDQEGATVECGLAVRRRGRDEHDRVARLPPRSEEHPTD